MKVMEADVCDVKRVLLSHNIELSDEKLQAAFNLLNIDYIRMNCLLGSNHEEQLELLYTKIEQQLMDWGVIQSKIPNFKFDRYYEDYTEEDLLRDIDELDLESLETDPDNWDDSDTDDDGWPDDEKELNAKSTS